jgi:hypothetical protein
MARAIATPNKGGGSTLLVLLFVLGIVVLTGGGVAAYAFMSSASPPTVAGAEPTPGAGGGGPAGGIGDLIGKEIRSPQVLFDEELAVSAAGAQMRSFTLPSPRPISVEVRGVKNSDKGFMVYVMEESEWENFKTGKFRHVPEFEGLKIRSSEHTGALPAGSWAVVVQNSENILNTMVVQVRVVSDPK